MDGFFGFCEGVCGIKLSEHWIGLVSLKSLVEPRASAVAEVAAIESEPAKDTCSKKCQRSHSTLRRPSRMTRQFHRIPPSPTSVSSSPVSSVFFHPFHLGGLAGFLAVTSRDPVPSLPAARPHGRVGALGRSLLLRQGGGAKTTDMDARIVRATTGVPKHRSEARERSDDAEPRDPGFCGGVRKRERERDTCCRLDGFFQCVPLILESRV